MFYQGNGITIKVQGDVIVHVCGNHLMEDYVVMEEYCVGVDFCGERCIGDKRDSVSFFTE